MKLSIVEGFMRDQALCSGDILTFGSAFLVALLGFDATKLATDARATELLAPAAFGKICTGAKLGSSKTATLATFLMTLGAELVIDEAVRKAQQASADAQRSAPEDVGKHELEPKRLRTKLK